MTDCESASNRNWEHARNSQCSSCCPTHQWGNVCPARYLCIKYPISSPKFILT